MEKVIRINRNPEDYPDAKAILDKALIKYLKDNKLSGLTNWALKKKGLMPSMFKVNKEFLIYCKWLVPLSTFEWNEDRIFYKGIEIVEDTSKESEIREIKPVIGDKEENVEQLSFND